MNNFSQDQKIIYDHFVNTKDNLFITGCAGTGKSYLINSVLESNPNCDIVSSTGASAILVGGTTFHSFFGINIMQGGIEDTVQKAERNPSVVKRLNKARCVIIDEVSMISGLQLQAAEEICRLVRKNNNPWGGLRIVAVGDFAQLPPVNKASNYYKDWCFLSDTWKKSNFTSFYLTTIHRTDDDEFIDVLNKIRIGNITPDVENYLNGKVSITNDDIVNENNITMLFAKKNQVDKINNYKLECIESEERVFETRYTIDSKYLKSKKYIYNNFPISEKVKLKVGCYVMIRVNNFKVETPYVNGTCGIVTEIDKYGTYIKIQTENGIVTLNKHKFEYLNSFGRPIATAHNFPIVLAYAITIHKSQGATIDRVLTHLANLWEPGQAYTALSRLKNGNGLYLIDWNKDSIKVDNNVINFYKEIAS